MPQALRVSQEFLAEMALQVYQVFQALQVMVD